MTMESNRRSDFGLNCVQCGNELMAPERSEYWSDGHARHVWYCDRCSLCFESLVSFHANTMSIQESMTGNDGLSVVSCPVGV
jgi:hypothetical protein